MHLSIITPNRTVFKGDVDSGTFPGTQGRFHVLKNHAPTVSSLTAGELKYTMGTEALTLKIKNGFVSINENEIKVLCEVQTG
ncbi:MAG TPA: F0F1 ATP synthase subunit epsilon [Amoebophilaceae bacterium]|jgi:F-type H+-transporting ATPase subunit epsilon|nr:F0F1 ATP synthase subunit epsilon [Amoebophilaceae bacterium]